ncbi:hypothetical protein D9758_006465 [Tetrapyrgos nigripes]|uniref:Uncharacterized protein n=1 Tax=Tetrapyrgos nigripes TaxID=182062 RepID=A0A8H5GKH3_9AGAR|nr:hypothetical protein D9758_006465 [Tetrapyrgos nigripes]
MFLLPGVQSEANLQQDAFRSIATYAALAIASVSEMRQQQVQMHAQHEIISMSASQAPSESQTRNWGKHNVKVVGLDLDIVDSFLAQMQDIKDSAMENAERSLKMRVILCWVNKKKIRKYRASMERIDRDLKVSVNLANCRSILRLAFAFREYSAL